MLPTEESVRQTTLHHHAGLFALSRIKFSLIAKMIAVCISLKPDKVIF